MKRYIFSLIVLIQILTSAYAQQINTLYFMDNVPYRNQLNPAFQPMSKFYLGFPVLGFTQFGFGNNALSVKDLIYQKDNQLISFLHPNGSVDDFYNTLPSQFLIYENAQVNLLTFGFRTGRAYWNVSINEKMDAGLGIPKDFFRLLLYGMPDKTNVNVYDLSNLNINLTSYIDFGLGYSREINKTWTVGAKVKMLLGYANMSVENDNLTLKGDIEQWSISGRGKMKVALPGEIVDADGFPPFEYTAPTEVNRMLKPAGTGIGADFGLTFSPFSFLTLSAAVTDFGYIRWKNVQQSEYTTDYSFKGFKDVALQGSIDTKALLDSVRNGFEKSVVTTKSTSAYTTSITPKVNIGAELGLVPQHLTLGVLSRTLVRKSNLEHEITTSLNIKPLSWFDLSGSYSLLEGRMSNVGVGLGLRIGFIHGFLAADYVPLRFAGMGGSSSVLLPYNTKGINFGFGASFVFGNKKDKDHDGVRDGKDRCPDTPKETEVDRYGCPIDSDEDGVADNKDQCADTPSEAKGLVDSMGCPTDKDGDGVVDYLDQCPDTPIEAQGKVDEKGCPLDADKDGVPDYNDKCPATQAGVIVGDNGCAKDEDGDGVQDSMDKCPGTPQVARAMVDSLGCPWDKDQDGVSDYMDSCLTTPFEHRMYVDKKGCILDSDGDGVPDYMDQCKDTVLVSPSTVDAKGCPKDTDGDGVPDFRDNCSMIFGSATNSGCPELKKEVKEVFAKALQGIQFEKGKSVITRSSYAVLNQVAAVLNANLMIRVEIQGHTDNVGNSSENLTLSENRAKAVRDYLLDKGVADSRMSYKGFGDTEPLMVGNTEKARSKNRRVEFVVKYE